MSRVGAVTVTSNASTAATPNDITFVGEHAVNGTTISGSGVSAVFTTNGLSEYNSRIRDVADGEHVVIVG